MAQKQLDLVPLDLEPVDKPTPKLDLKPVDTPDSTPEETNPLINAWRKLNAPTVQLGTTGSEIEQGKSLFAQEHPYISKGVNFLADTASELTSPISLLSGGTGVGEGLAAKYGMKGIQKGLGLASTATALPTIGAGVQDIYEGHPLAGAAELAMGGMGLRNAKSMLANRSIKSILPEEAIDLSITAERNPKGHFTGRRLNKQGQVVDRSGKILLNPRGDGEVSLIRDIWDVPKGPMTVDFPFFTSAAFRQGAAFAGTRNWVKAFADQAKAFGSEKVADAIMSKLDEHPLYIPRSRVLKDGTTKTLPSIAEELGLKKISTNSLTNRQEQIRTSLAEKLPLYSRYIKASNRSFVAFMESLRTSVADDWLKAADVVSSSGKIIKPYEGKQLINTLNELTASNNLKFGVPFTRFTGNQKEIDLSRASDALSTIFFSPNILARDAKMMNPLNYMKNDKVDRLKYLEGAIRRAGVWASFTGLAYLLGADVSMDPTSSDFGKAKVGDTRLDAGTGLLQWLVLGTRQSMGETTSSTADSQGNHKTTEFGSSYVAPTRGKSILDFGINRLHPSASLVVKGLMASKSNPFYPMSEAAERMTPMYTNDLMELIGSNPELGQILLGMTGSLTSLGTMTYGDKPFGEPRFNILGDPKLTGGNPFK